MSNLDKWERLVLLQLRKTGNLLSTFGGKLAPSRLINWQERLRSLNEWYDLAKLFDSFENIRALARECAELEKEVDGATAHLLQEYIKWSPKSL